MTASGCRRAGAALALVCVLASPIVAGGQAPSPAPLRRRAELTRLDALLAAGDNAAAGALLQTLEPELAKNERLSFDVIYVLVGRSAYGEARAQWNRLAPRLQERLRTDPPPTNDPSDANRLALGEALFTQALLTEGRDASNEALQLLQQADGLGFPPLDSPLMLLAAARLVDLRQYALAAKAYGEYLKVHPSDATARAGLGAALYSSGKFHEARKELERVLEAAPATPRANYTLAATLFELKLYAEARQRLARELARDPRCTPCLARLAHIAYLEGDDRQCEAWLSKATSVDGDDIETQLVAGMLALRGGRHAEAIAHLSRVVDRSPEFPTARYQLATAYLRAGQPEQARVHMEVYQRLLKEQKARDLGVRGAK